MRDYRSSKSADQSTDTKRSSIDDEEGYDHEAVRSRSLWLINREVQRLAAESAATKDEVAVQETAAAGVAGPGTELPHRERIQAAFGPHDVSHVRAHVGGDAAQAAGAIGAKAYATGNDVAFADAPDLHTAAHEAAHVVQQRQGVHLNGGVGQAGDAYEQQADGVADAVVRGESAISLLGEPRERTGGRGVQAKGNGRHDDSGGKERDFKPSGAVAEAVSARHYRFWGFEVDSDDARSEFNALLTTVATYLHRDPTARAQVIGHTSTSAGEGHNFDLSVRRAQSIVNQLAARGVNPERLMVLGGGENTPLVDEAGGPEAMARNRRVEIQMLNGPPAAAPPKETPRPPSATSMDAVDAMGCRNLALEVRLLRAQLEVWTMVEAQGYSRGTPVRGFLDENAVQPSIADWRAACLSNRVPEKVCLGYYDKVKSQVGANLLDLKHELQRLLTKYEASLDEQTCDPAVPLDPWFANPDYQIEQQHGADDIGRMPGHTDPGGRRY